MKSLVIGGTGFVGRSFIKRLDNPIIAGRSITKIQRIFGEVEAREWDLSKPPDPSFVDGVETVFNLAGESVFGERWNAEKKERIRNSRVEGTRHLVDTIAAAEKKPKVLVNSSAVGIYGDRVEERLTEQSAPGNDFLAQVGLDWEKEAMRAEEYGVRVVLIRTGVVLGTTGGALAQMLLPFKFGLGGKLGNGKQYMPWIHIDDLTAIMHYAMVNTSLRGPVNGVAPNPVSNKEFTRALATAVHRPALLPVPGFALKTALGEFGTVLLGSQRVLPEVLLQEGFEFQYPEIGAALQDLV